MQCVQKNFDEMSTISSARLQLYLYNYEKDISDDVYDSGKVINIDIKHHIFEKNQ